MMDRLLSIFLLTLAAHGLAPGSLDPWRGWMAFKEYARMTSEFPDPGMSVQFTPVTEDGEAQLIFLRQKLEPRKQWLAAVGGVVCELRFEPLRRDTRAWDLWSFDYSSFERFVDVVEQEPAFQDLMVKRPQYTRESRRTRARHTRRPFTPSWRITRERHRAARAAPLP
jgi:hypothetical protein